MEEKEDLIFNVSDVKGVSTHTVADSKLPMVSWLLTLSKLVKAGSSTRFQRLGDWLSGEVTYPDYPARGGRPEIVTLVFSRWMPAPSFRTVTRKFEYISKRGRVREWKEKNQGGNVRGRHCLLKEQEPWPPTVLGLSPAFPRQLHGLERVLSLSQLQCPHFPHGIITVPTSKSKHARNNLCKLPVTQQVFSPRCSL